MRNLLKATTLESKFPLLAVEGGCIISKDADITVVYRVELPELFTVTSAEYEAIHAAWCKALKVLPEYSVVHKQDWFIRERYRPATGEGDMSFLSRSYERHFNERPFLTHACFLYLTKTTRERMHMRSDFSTLCRGNIIPKEVNRESATKFLEAAEQFERILNDSGFLALVRLTGDEITGTADCPGLLERYFSLSLSETTSLQAWAEDEEELRRIKNDTGSQLALMGCVPHYNTIDTPVLYWSGIPGNAGDFPAEESFYTFLEQAVCLFASETNYRSSPSPFGIRMTDRQSGVPLHLDISDLPMRKGIITNRNKFILGPSGSGKSFFTNHLVRQYYEQGTHILLVDTGNSYQGLCSLIHDRTHGEDGIYITYEEENPIAFNPFYTDSGEFDVEKRESIKTLILTLWKREDEAPRRSEEVALSGAVNAYIRRITENRDVRPDFNGFYEFVRDDYRRMIEEKKVREKDFDIDGFLNVLEPFYRGGDYDFLLNSDKELDLTNKRFIVFELDNISGNKVLLPVVTLIIMETFIAKMRRLKGIRKMILIEECWKALMSANMSEYIKYLFKTVRKYFGEAVVVTQEVDDIISSPVVKEAIINNSDCKILLDQRKYMNKFDHIQRLLGLTVKERGQILSINQANHPGRFYREVWIGLGGTHSAVYATEVSDEEYAVYTTEESEKLELQKLAKELGGNLELAVKRIAEMRRERKRSNGKA